MLYFSLYVISMHPVLYHKVIECTYVFTWLKETKKLKTLSLAVIEILNALHTDERSYIILLFIICWCFLITFSFEVLFWCICAQNLTVQTTYSLIWLQDHYLLVLTMYFNKLHLFRVKAFLLLIFFSHANKI